MQLKSAAFKTAQFLKLGPLLRMLKANSVLRTSGWSLSVHRLQSVDRDGNPIPWLTYGAIAFLDERLKSDFEMFEYGAGNSTIWFSRRVGRVTAVEHLASWAETAGRGVGRVLIREVENSEDYVKISFAGVSDRNGYTDSILEQPTLYDVIVIDGVFRNACVMPALERLKPAGVLILDNTDYEEFAPGMSHLTNSGFRVIHFSGMAPITQRESRTSVFYRPDNCFGI